MKFSKGKWKVLLLGWDNLTQRSGASWTKSSSAEQDLVVLRNYRLSMRQRLILLAQAVNQILRIISESVARRPRAMTLLPAPCWSHRWDVSCLRGPALLPWGAPMALSSWSQLPAVLHGSPPNPTKLQPK